MEEGVTVILNLEKDESETHKITRYPDGQISVRVRDADVETEILSRMSSFSDVQKILCAAAAIRNLSPLSRLSLNVPYFLGARSDRRFSIDQDFYLKDVICPLVNSVGFSRVFVLDPHSTVLPALVDRCVVHQPISLWKMAAKSINSTSGITILCPDAGAQKRAEMAAEHMGAREIVYCTKSRDISTGRITKACVPCDDFKGRDVVIVDDICDGGRTFTWLAGLVANRNVKGVYLVVTHGIFSAGFDELGKHFTQIFCTDSYKCVTHDLVTQYKLFEEN